MWQHHWLKIYNYSILYFFISLINKIVISVVLTYNFWCKSKSPDIFSYLIKKINNNNYQQTAIVYYRTVKWRTLCTTWNNEQMLFLALKYDLCHKQYFLISLSVLFLLIRKYKMSTFEEVTRTFLAETVWLAALWKGQWKYFSLTTPRHSACTWLVCFKPIKIQHDPINQLNQSIRLRSVIREDDGIAVNTFILHWRAKIRAWQNRENNEYAEHWGF